MEKRSQISNIWFRRKTPGRGYCPEKRKEKLPEDHIEIIRSAEKKQGAAILIRLMNIYTLSMQLLFAGRRGKILANLPVVSQI